MARHAELGPGSRHGPTLDGRTDTFPLQNSDFSPCKTYHSYKYDSRRRGRFGRSLFAVLATAAPAGPPAADYPQAHWLAASPSNYSRANRPLSGPINMVVIHATEGSYAGTLQWFRNSRSHATAHYVVRSSDGDVTQMVREKDEAWHSGNGDVNDRSIGIEHEGWTNDCSWMTEAMYRSSAQLSAYLAIKYLIPIDRKHFIAHSEVPDPNHSGEFGGYRPPHRPGALLGLAEVHGPDQGLRSGQRRQRNAAAGRRLDAHVRAPRWLVARGLVGGIRAQLLGHPAERRGDAGAVQARSSEDRELRAVRVVAGGRESEQLGPGGNRHIDRHAVGPRRPARRDRLALPGLASRSPAGSRPW